MATLLRLRDFRLIVIAYAISFLGDALALVALTIRVHDLTGSGGAVAALLLAQIAPRVALAPVTGLLVDRFETVRVLIVAALVQAALSAGLAFTHTLPLLLVLSAALGAVAGVDSPAAFALVPRAVGAHRVGRANAALEVARYGGGAAGPVVAGALAAGVGTGAALLANAASFVVLAMLAAALRVRRRPEPVARDGDRRSARARAGFAFVARDRLLRLTFVFTAAVVVFAVIDNVAGVFFAKDVLLAGDLGYGVLLTTWSVGMVAGALLTGRWAPGGSLALAVIGAAIMGGLAVGGAAAAAAFPVAVPAFAAGGFANGVHNVAMRTLVHHRAPGRLHGRVFAAYGALTASGQIGALALGGAVVGLLGARGALLLAGFGEASVGLAALIRYVRLPGGARDERYGAPA